MKSKALEIQTISVLSINVKLLSLNDLLQSSYVFTQIFHFNSTKSTKTTCLLTETIIKAPCAWHSGLTDVRLATELRAGNNQKGIVLD